MKSLSKNFLAFAAVLATLFAHPLCTEALVLCVGSDGHVEFEPVAHDACGDDLSAVSSAAVISATNKHTDSCIDIPLIHGAQAYVFNSHIRATAPQVAIVLIDPAANLEPAASFNGVKPLLPPPSHISSLHSVLLRV